MWPKLMKKSSNFDFEPLKRTESVEEIESRRTARLLHQLGNIAAVLMQCGLVATIILLLVKLPAVFNNLGSPMENSRLSGTFDAVEEKYAAMFEDFIKTYNKVYADDNEKNFRLSIFVKNVIYFEEEEKKHPDLDLDVTRFADWTEEEMRKFLSSDPRETSPQAPLSEQAVPHDKVKRPAAVDWVNAGKVAPVKDQGQCGSCWAFATVASVEAVYAMKTGLLTRLSEQEMVDCDSRNNGCGGGYRPYAMSFIMKHGLMKEAEYPYLGTDHNTCRLGNSTDRVFIRNYRTLSTDENAVADWIANNGPVTFGMNVTKALYSYRSGIFSPPKEDCEDHSLGSHAMAFVGYGVDGSQEYWLVKNSWGARWGQNGYFKLARGLNACGAANNVVGPLV